MQETSPFHLLQPCFSDSWDFTNQGRATGKYRGAGGSSSSIAPPGLAGVHLEWQGLFLCVTGDGLLLSSDAGCFEFGKLLQILALALEQEIIWGE